MKWPRERHIKGGHVWVGGEGGRGKGFCALCAWPNLRFFCLGTYHSVWLFLHGASYSSLTA